MALLAYAGRFSARPGESIDLKVSASTDYRLEFVRHVGHSRPAIACRTAAEGSYPTSIQPLALGSYMIVPQHLGIVWPDRGTFAAWIRPSNTSPRRAQVIAELDGIFRIYIEDRLVHVSLPDDKARLTRPIDCDDWSLITLTTDDAGQLRLTLSTRDGVADHVQLAAPVPRSPLRESRQFTLAATVRPGTVVDGFNGRIDSPFIGRRPMDEDDIRALVARVGPEVLFGRDLIARWDFSTSFTATTIDDLSANGHDGTLVNQPARAMPGWRWDGASADNRAERHQFSAVHFHDDDLEDADWETTASLVIPSDWEPGVYSAHLASASDEFWVPFVIRPGVSRSAKPILVLLPTLTYLAYGNWRQSHESKVFVQGDYSRIMAHPIQLHSIDAWLNDHPEVGLSLYERHSDGTGVMYASMRRPLVNLRPDYTDWKTAAPRHFSADLILVEFLEQIGANYDVATEHDLHAEGMDALRGYSVVITGSHPEYYTSTMLDALETYLDAGGNLMYLGGNGFYGVAAVPSDRPHLMEIRRGFEAGPWRSEPGETFMSSTGEAGGVWRVNGRPPNALVGVGYVSSGWEGGAPYLRTPASHDPRFEFIFAGVGDEPIGDFGESLGAAAGDELDGYDLRLGSPPDATVLASSAGLHSRYYELEDVDLVGSSGPQNPRADMVHWARAGGGQVFAVGSMNWITSLMHDGGSNNVARITSNVLTRLADTARG